MNDTTDTDNNKTGGLKGSFGDRGINVNAMGYGHPHADKIISEAKEVLYESDTGQLFLKVLDHYRIPINIMKGTGSGGFSQDMKTITLQVPGKIKDASGEFVLDFAKSIREAELYYTGQKAPDPTKDLIKYASFVHARNMDGLWYNCTIVKELTNSSYFSVLPR